MSINFEVVTLSNPFQGHYKILTNKAKKTKLTAKPFIHRKGAKDAKIILNEIIVFFASLR
jgi:hypothetical protein